MIALEYYSRSENFENFINYPFSIFFEKNDDGLVLTFHKTDDQIIVKRWDLGKQNLYSSLINDEYNCLPEMKEYKINYLSNIKDIEIIPKNFKILKYKLDFFTNKSERIDSYYNYIYSILNSENFKTYANSWLWYKYLQLFHEDIYNILKFINKNITVAEQKSLVFERYKSSEKHWNIWEKVLRPSYITDKNSGCGCAPEFLFRNFFD